MTSDEFTGWRKATYSHANSNCVEVGWRKAAYSHGDGDCVEVAAAQRAVCVRDSTQAGRGYVLEFPAGAWRVFIATARTANA